MSQGTAIEWTDATWNPVTGCSKVSPGCAHCYAETLSLRWGRSAYPWIEAHAAQNVVLHPERLDHPRRWRKASRVFVNSMSDLFHEQIPDEYVFRVLETIADCPQHIFQVLTKRPERMRELVQSYMAREGLDSPLPNLWLGVSVENQRWARTRIPVLLEVAAAVRFLSCEPLLGAVDLRDWVDFAPSGRPPAASGSRIEETRVAHDASVTRSKSDGLARREILHWIIVGGQSGPKHRPIDMNWVRAIRDQCQAARVAFFFEQNRRSHPKSGRTPARRPNLGRVSSWPGI